MDFYKQASDKQLLQKIEFPVLGLIQGLISW